MVRKSFTLIEVIYVIVILSFVLTGGFQIIGKLYERNYIVKTTTNFEFATQTLLDQVSGTIYYRIPLSVIGYNPVTNDFKYIGEVGAGEDYPVVEWIGYLNEAMVERNLSGFVDLYKSPKPTIKAVDFNSAFINGVLKNKFKIDKNLTELSAIVFAGSFDIGGGGALIDYNSSFGWHGNDARLVYKIDEYNQIGDDCNLKLKEFNGSNIINATIYERFYLVDSAYAIALKKDLKMSEWNCSISSNKFKNNDLLLFYNYRPWKGETFCGNGGGGSVTLLASNIKSFKVGKVNYHLVIKASMFKSKKDINITVSKQKVTF